MKVFHGSNLRVEDIDLEKCEDRKDFGKGFYTTSIREHAVEWSEKIAAWRGGKPTVTAYDFDEHVFEDTTYRTLRFTAPSRDWVLFVFMNRTAEKINPHRFDIVEGPIADDWIKNKIERYEKKEITLDELVKKLAFHEPTHQICCCTVRGLQALKALKHTFWEVEKIANAIGDALVANGMDKIEAQNLLYTSATYEQLADLNSGLYLKPWAEIYELLKKEVEAMKKL